MSVPTSDRNLFADEVLLDPYPLYAELRELGGVVHLPANDVYALTRYDVIRGALGSPETFSSRTIAFNPMANEALQGTSLASDPPIPSPPPRGPPPPAARGGAGTPPPRARSRPPRGPTRPPGPPRPPRPRRSTPSCARRSPRTSPPARCAG